MGELPLKSRRGRYAAALRLLLLLSGPAGVGLALAAGWPGTFREPAAGAGCRWLRIARAWDDRDHDARQDAGEPPLAGVRFAVADARDELADVGSVATSDASGIAVLTLTQRECPAPGAGLEISATPPAGFAATSPAQLRARGAGPYWFGFARVVAEP